MVVEARCQGNTFLQACPARDMEVQRVRVVFGGFGGPAGFEEAARALETRRLRTQTIIGGNAVTIEFIFPARTDVEFLVFPDRAVPACAQAGSYGVHRIEMVLGQAAAAAQGDGVAALSVGRVVLPREIV